MTNQEINNIKVVEPEILTENKKELQCESRVDKVCDPESLFEMIETCKICGRCV